MPRYPQIIAGLAGRFTLRLAVFYGALGVVIGVQLPFLPVWLAAKGLDAEAIGIVLAVPMVVRVFAIPVASRIADRRDALRGVIAVAASLAVVGYCVLGLAAGVVAIFIVYTIASAIYSPVLSLCDAYALRGLAVRGRAYGPLRLWASVGFIVTSLGAGFFLDALPPADLIWLIVGALAASAACGSALAPLDASPAKPPQAASATSLLRDQCFLAVFAAASLVQSSHAVYYGFATIDWRTAGYDGGVVGALWSLGVIAEVILFAFSGRLPPVVGPTVLLTAGACGAAVRWSAMALGPSPVLLLPLQCLHALSFAATHLGATMFVARNAPHGLGATAQGYLGVAIGLAMAAATGLAGVLYGRYGGLAYGAMAIIAAGGVACAVLAHRLEKTTAG